MKRILFFSLLSTALLLQSVSAARPVPVQVDGSHLPNAAYVENGVTYVPLRHLLDAFGGWDTQWDSTLRAAVATSEDMTLTADPAAQEITVGDDTYSARVTVENGRTYVPLRLITEALEGKALWDPYLGGAAVTSPDAAYDARDLYWLSRIISAESRGETEEGQIAVGNVVLNRVGSPDFPDSIPAVIFDRKNGVQFEPVSNGTVYAQPAPQSAEVARQVLDGAVVLENALYFYAPALSQGLWINANRSYLTTIGCHRFYL